MRTPVASMVATLALIAPAFAPAPAVAAPVPIGPSIMHAVAEDTNYYRFLTGGLSPGNSQGVGASSIDPEIVKVYETRGFYGPKDPPCYRFRTAVRYSGGAFRGTQEAWRVSCSTGTILADGRRPTRYWTRWT
jgi:hypothetical protein